MRGPLARGLWLALPLAILLIALTFATPAGAITKKRADTIAKKALKPAKQEGQIVLAGLRRPLAAKQHVSEALPRSPSRKKTVKQKVKPIGRRAWLYWLDLAHGARFQHESKMLLVDDRTGRVLKRRRLLWWPLVDGKAAAFAGRGYEKRKRWVYTNLPRPPAKRSGVFGGGPAPPAGISTHDPTSSVPPGAFDNDCVLMLGLTKDPSFARDFKAMRESGQRHHFRVFNVNTNNPKRDPSGRDMRAVAKQLTQPPHNCKDILLYFSAHGYQILGPAGTEPALDVGSRKVAVQKDDGTQVEKTRSVVAWGRDVAGILTDNPDTTFKIKIDACYSGMWIDYLPLEKYPNLLVIETSSARNEVSWSFIPAIMSSLGQMVVNERNPRRLGEFTNGNLHGIDEFAKSQDEVSAAQTLGGSLFAQMLYRAFSKGRTRDFAREQELTHPQVRTRLPLDFAPPAEDPTPPATDPDPPATDPDPPASDDFSVTVAGGYKHPDGSPTSLACADVATDPARGGAGFKATLEQEQPPDSGTYVEKEVKTGTLTGAGTAHVSFTITQGGSNVRYRIRIEVTADDVVRQGDSGPFATPFSPPQTKDCQPAS